MIKEGNVKNNGGPPEKLWEAAKIQPIGERGDLHFVLIVGLELYLKKGGS